MDYYRVIYQVHSEYQAWPARQPGEGPPAVARAPMTFERLSTEAAILSESASAVGALQGLIEETGATEILGWMNMGSISHELVLRSMERFADKVMPRLAAGAARS